jgi:alpha-galactosidase
MPHKITIIGGGSSMFTPQLMSLFIQSKPLQGSTISLMDINPRRLELMDTLSKQLVQKTGADLKVESTTDRTAALTGADYVIVAISVGGFEAWEKDLEIPAKYGVYQSIGDSIGPGGILRAFRHVLPMVQICKDLEKVSPKAWVLNYTNPATTLAWVMNKESNIKVVSLCTNTVNLRSQKFMATLVGVKPGEVVLPPTIAGINHCSAIIELHLKDGSDAFPLMLKKARHPLVRWGLETHHIMPIVWPHWCEFYPMMCKLKSEYKGRIQGLFLSYGMQVKDMQVETGRIRQWEKMVAGWAKGEGEASLAAIPPTEPVQVVEIIEALIEDRQEIHGVNIPNHGAIENLPDDAVVEIMGLVSGQSIRPIHAGRLPESIAAFHRLYIDSQKLTAEAALTGDRRIALQAFESDPFVAATLELEKIPVLMNEMLAAHAENLPQFN